MEDEAYYDMKIEELREKTKNLSLVVKGVNENEGNYQIWSSGSDDKEMCDPSHEALFVKYDGKVFDEKFVKSGEIESGCEAGMFDSEEVSGDGENLVEGRCLMATTLKSPMIKKVPNIIMSLNIPFFI